MFIGHFRVCVQVSEETAGSLVTRLFGKEVSSVTRLDSYVDANFKIVVAGSGETFTLKVRSVRFRSFSPGHRVDLIVGPRQLRQLLIGYTAYL